MTPPPAASHADRTGTIGLGRTAGDLVAGTTARLIDPRNWSQFCLLVDVVILYLAATAALFGAPGAETGASRWLAATFPPLTLLLLRARRSPDERLHGSSLETAAYVISVVSVATMTTIAAGTLLGGTHTVSLALRLWLFGVVYLALARVLLLSIRRQALRSPALATPTLIVGAGVVGEHLVKRLINEPAYGLRPVGYIDADPMSNPERSGSERLPVLGHVDDLPAAVQRTGARRVIVAFSSEPDHVLVDKVRECDRLGVEVSLVPRLFESVNARAALDHVGGVPLLTLRPTDPLGWQFAVKHGVDRVVALMALVALSPIMLAVMAAVRLSSPGPILFRQRRVGRDGYEFDVLKFRTMREVADAAQRFELPAGVAPGGVEGEDRRTRVGRVLRSWSLDEVPQLINVVRGDMSLVGPRPERPEYVERFSRDVSRYADRHRVKSGITGWAQVNGLRGQTSIVDRAEWDNYYIQNWSLALDLRILALTLAEVLRFRDSVTRLPGNTEAAQSPTRLPDSATTV
jgi:exopolysaccharide biosynthesis polyprenyl glycosylphosphotransferase